MQSNIGITKPAPPAKPDSAELNVVNATLAADLAARKPREKHGWTYGAYSAFGMNLGGAFEASAETRNEVCSRDQETSEMKRLRDEPATDAEITLQRQYNVGNYLLSLENSSRTAQRVQDIDLYNLPTDFYKTYSRRMSETTPAKVQELAKKYISTENLAIVVVGEAKEIKPELEKSGFHPATELALVRSGLNKALSS